MLSHTVLFSKITDSEIENILEGLKYRVVTFQKDQMVIKRGTPYDRLLIVISGLLRSELIGENTRLIRLKDFNPTEIVAPALLYGQKDSFPVDLIAKEETAVMSIEKESLFRLFQERPAILRNYLGLISNMFIFISEKLDYLNFNTIRKKLAFLIIKLYEIDGKSLKLPLPVAELAEFFGVERPSLSYVITQFVREGIWNRNGRNCFILPEIDRIYAVLEEN